MSFFGKALASIGIGGANISISLDGARFKAGDTVTGKAHVQGGSQPQEISGIDLMVLVCFEEKAGDKKRTRQVEVGRSSISESFTVHEDESREFPFSSPLPADTLLTLGGTRVLIKGELGIRQGMDPLDKQEIEVEPPELVRRAMTALSDSGLSIREVECDQKPKHVPSRLPVIQKLKYRPHSGEFKKRLEDLEAVFVPKSVDEVQVFLEIDRRARGISGRLAEAVGTGKKKTSITLTEQESDSLEDSLLQLLRDSN